MTTPTTPRVHLHNPQPTQRVVEKVLCPTCGDFRDMLSEFTPWYGWLTTCIGCGESWQDGERFERPFAPGWRKKSIQRALSRLNAPLVKDYLFDDGQP